MSSVHHTSFFPPSGFIKDLKLRMKMGWQSLSPLGHLSFFKPYPFFENRFHSVLLLWSLDWVQVQCSAPRCDVLHLQTEVATSLTWSCFLWSSSSAWEGRTVAPFHSTGCSHKVVPCFNDAEVPAPLCFSEWQDFSI